MGTVISVNDNSNVLDFNSRSFKEREKELAKQEEHQEKIKKREKGSPFSRWSQFNLEYTKELMWLAMKHPKAHAILYFLVDQMDDYNAVMCSYQVLQEVFEISKPTITRSIKVLKDYGFIAVMKSGNNNVYTINDKVYWKNYGDKYHLSKFPANIVLTASEQEEDVRREAIEVGYSKIKEINIK